MRMIDESGVEQIRCANPMEEAARRYWRASSIWRDRQESTWNFGDMIEECRGLLCYRGRAAYLGEELLSAVVDDKRITPYVASNDTNTQNTGS